jgi:hypothetical protein
MKSQEARLNVACSADALGRIVAKQAEPGGIVKVLCGELDVAEWNELAFQ